MIVFDNDRGTFNVPGAHRGPVARSVIRAANPRLDRQYGLCYNGFYTVNIWEVRGDNLHRAAAPIPFSTNKDARRYLENDSDYSGGTVCIAEIHTPAGRTVGQYLSSRTPGEVWYQ